MNDEMTLADAARIARDEAAKHSGDVRTALTMLADAIYVTPKAAIDAVVSNPPLSPEEPGDDHMSRPEAACVLSRLAVMRKLDVDAVTALQMGVRTLLKRHFDRQRNRAKRRMAKQQQYTKEA